MMLQCYYIILMLHQVCKNNTTVFELEAVRVGLDGFHTEQPFLGVELGVDSDNNMKKLQLPS